MGLKGEKVCMCVCDAFLLAYISPYISKVNGHFWLKFGRLLSIYRALMLLNFCGNREGGWELELNFLGFQIEEKFGKQSFKYLSKMKFGQKNFSPKPFPPQKIQKMTKYLFFCKFFTRYD